MNHEPAPGALTRQLRTVSLHLPVLDTGEGDLVAVDASASGTCPVAACAVVHGTGDARCHVLSLEESCGPATAVVYAFEGIAAEAALRTFADQAAATLITDSAEVFRLLRNEINKWRRRSPAGSPLDRTVPQTARALRRHGRRLDLELRRDQTTARHVGESPLIVAAHRLALGTLQLHQAGAPLLQGSKEIEWLTAFAQHSGRHVKRIQVKARKYTRTLERQPSAPEGTT